MSSKYITTQAIILKRHNFSDAHRYITFFSQTHGKISAMAKGVRKISSNKRASLEIFNHIQLQLYQSKDHYIVTETKLISSFPTIKQNLYSTTQAFQLLEIIDSLTAELESHPNIFNTSLQLLHSINNQQSSKTNIIQTFKFMLDELGFGTPPVYSESSLKQHIETVADHPLRSKNYLIDFPS